MNKSNFGIISETHEIYTYCHDGGGMYARQKSRILGTFAIQAVLDTKRSIKGEQFVLQGSLRCILGCNNA